MDKLSQHIANPLCLAVLNRFVDLTDYMAIEDRSRDVSFRLTEKFAKSLYSPAEPGEDNEAWFALNELKKEGWFRIELGKVTYGDPEFLSNPRPRLILNPVFESEVRACLDRKERPNHRLMAWRQLVDQMGSLFPGSTEKLRYAPLEVKGMSDLEVLNQLLTVPSYFRRQLFLRELSARLFLGCSKILDGKGHIITELFGLKDDLFPEKPISLTVHIPPDWIEKTVIFIENETTFISLAKGKFAPAKSCALIYSSGFKASASRIREENNVFPAYTLRSDNSNFKKSFEEWLLGGNETITSYFWGDLDFSGAQILKALRVAFPGTLSWLPGYQPMLDVVRNGGGHPPLMADKELQEDPSQTGCWFMDNELLPLMRNTGTFLDQEYVYFSE